MIWTTVHDGVWGASGHDGKKLESVICVVAPFAKNGVRLSFDELVHDEVDPTVRIAVYRGRLHGQHYELHIEMDGGASCA